MTRTSTKSQVKVSTLILTDADYQSWYGGGRLVRRTAISQGVIQVGDMMALIQYLMLIMYALVMMSLIFALMPPRQRMRGAHYGGAGN